MPRGGARIGAGRPKGSTKAQLAARAAAGVAAPAVVLRAAKKAGRISAPKSNAPAEEAKVKVKKEPAAAKFSAGKAPGAAKVTPKKDPVAEQLLEAKVEQPAPTVAEQPPVIPEKAPQSPLEYLFERMNDPTVPKADRDRIAIALAPYMHAKNGEIGKKDLAQQAAENVSTGRFATAAPPKLSVVRP